MNRGFSVAPCQTLISFDSHNNSLQVKEMDHELERYHKNNAALDLTISDLKLKLDGVHKESLVQRKSNADLHAVIRQFHHDLHQTAQHIQVPLAKRKTQIIWDDVVIDTFVIRVRFCSGWRVEKL
jgi:hypothetical protein